MEIAAYGTTRCDTGCKHCDFSSLPKGEDMSPDIIKKLKKTIRTRRKKEPVRIIFTGGGENLMWQYFPEAIRLLRDMPGVFLDLITSGCLDKKDQRFDVLREAFKQAEGKLRVEHSFNLFSTTFPQRLEFTLPFVLSKSLYKWSYIRMVAGFTRTNRYGLDFHLAELERVMENSLEKAVGKCSKFIPFSAKDNGLSPKKMTEALIQGGESAIEYAFYLLSFKAPTIYVPFNLALKDKRISGSTAFLSSYGRARNFCPADVENSYYNFNRGFACGAFSEILDMDTNGNFPYCSRGEFPPIYLGKAGDNFAKMVREKKRITKTLNFPRQWLAETGLHPCDNCIKKAWEMYYKIAK